jgi:hypothetical protein
MASEAPYLPARRSARYKDALVPRRFFQRPFHFSFVPSTFLRGPPNASGLHELHLACSPCPTERYDAASETIASARPSSLIRSDLPSSPSRRPSDRGSTLGNDADEVAGFPGLDGDVVTRRPEMPDPHCPTPSLLNASNDTSLCPNRGRPRCVSTLSSCLTTASCFADLYHGWDWAGEGGSGPAHTALR